MKTGSCKTWRLAECIAVSCLLHHAATCLFLHSGNITSAVRRPNSTKRNDLASPKRQNTNVPMQYFTR